MLVDIEFFCEDPLDNVLSCLKIKFDKVIFVGYKNEDMDTVARENVRQLLMSPKINVKEVEYIVVPERDMQGIRNRMEDLVKKELQNGNQCCFDMTGGEELVLAVAGILSERYGIPMHEVDAENDKLNMLTHEAMYQHFPLRSLYLTVREYLKLHEAIITEERINHFRDGIYPLDERDRFYKLFNLSKKMKKLYNKCAIGMSKLCPGKGTRYTVSVKGIKRAAIANGITPEWLIDFINRLYGIGYFKNYEVVGNTYSFAFYSYEEKAQLCFAGGALERYASLKMMELDDVTDCSESVKLDWDGDRSDISAEKVLNEIDVICMRKNIPVFISCKNKHVVDRWPLYELETVADRFGGKYVKKVLFTTRAPGAFVQRRADEMGIEIIIG